MSCRPTRPAHENPELPRVPAGRRTPVMPWHRQLGTQKQYFSSERSFYRNLVETHLVSGLYTSWHVRHDFDNARAEFAAASKSFAVMSLSTAAVSSSLLRANSTASGAPPFFAK